MELHIVLHLSPDAQSRADGGVDEVLRRLAEVLRERGVLPCGPPGGDSLPGTLFVEADAADAADVPLTLEVHPSPAPPVEERRSSAGVSEDARFLERAEAVVEAHLADADFHVSTFIEALHGSRSTVYRRLKALTGLSPVEYIRSIRLRRAAALLAEREMSVTQATYAVGYRDLRYFRQCFREAYGVTPSAYAAGVRDGAG